MWNGVDPHLLKEDDATWARLLFFAADQPGLVHGRYRADRVFLKCRRNLGEQVHLQSQFGELFSRLDFLYDLANAWKRVMTEVPAGNHGRRLRSGQATGQLPRSLRCASHQGNDGGHQSGAAQLDQAAAGSASAFHSLLRIGVGDPDSTLKALDGVQRNAPDFMSQLVRVLERLQYSTPLQRYDDSTMDEIEAQRAAFWAASTPRITSEFRNRLLSFCFRDYRRRNAWPRSWKAAAGTLEPDQSLRRGPSVRPLRCLCLAGSAFLGLSVAPAARLSILVDRVRCILI